MKVYLVERERRSNRHIEDVFDSREKSDNYVRERYKEADEYTYYEIQEFEVQ